MTDPSSRDASVSVEVCRISGAASAHTTPIGKIMTAPVLCVSPDLGLPELAALFLENGISGAPVIDDAGHPIGVVSKTDLLRSAHEASTSRDAVLCVEGRATVGDVMMPIVFCLPATESVARAAALMAFEGVHRLLVVEPHGEVVGVVCPIDVLAWLAREDGYLVATETVTRR